MSHSDGYKRVTVDGVRMYEHRYVARMHHPEVEQLCSYCERVISWELSPPNPHALIVDHYDHDRANNSPSNLVICCEDCNRKRKVTRAQANARDAMPA